MLIARAEYYSMDISPNGRFKFSQVDNPGLAQKLYLLGWSCIIFVHVIVLNWLERRVSHVSSFLFLCLSLLFWVLLDFRGLGLGRCRVSGWWIVR